MTDAVDASRQQGGLVVAAATGEPARLFVGRVRELWELLAALREGAAHRDLLFLVTGEPGIGKSRLMEELARLLEGQGWRVLVGRCWEHGGAPACWPWMQGVPSRWAASAARRWPPTWGGWPACPPRRWPT
jgi:AAA ATPase domain